MKANAWNTDSPSPAACSAACSMPRRSKGRSSRKRRRWPTSCWPSTGANSALPPGTPSGGNGAGPLPIATSQATPSVASNPWNPGCNAGEIFAPEQQWKPLPRRPRPQPDLPRKAHPIRLRQLPVKPSSPMNLGTVWGHLGNFWGQKTRKTRRNRVGWGFLGTPWGRLGTV